MEETCTSLPDRRWAIRLQEHFTDSCPKDPPHSIRSAGSYRHTLTLAWKSTRLAPSSPPALLTGRCRETPHRTLTRTTRRFRAAHAVSHLTKLSLMQIFTSGVSRSRQRTCASAAFVPDPRGPGYELGTAADEFRRFLQRTWRNGHIQAGPCS